MACRCSEVHVGGRPTGSYNWSPDCEEHRVGSEWWNSEEQVRTREDDSCRLRTLRVMAHHRRQQSVDVGDRVLGSWIELNHETAGFATYWYLWAAGSTYLLGDLY